MKKTNDFKKIKSTLYEVQINDCKFTIQKRKGLWWAKCESEVKSFNFPPRKTLQEAKELCKDNIYWD